MTERVGRNDPCPCGSGKKYKKCCELRASQKKINASVLSSGGLLGRVSANFFANASIPSAPVKSLEERRREKAESGTAEERNLKAEKPLVTDEDGSSKEEGQE